MRKTILLMIIIIEILGCKLKINSQENLIDDLKKIEKEFAIVLWKDKVDQKINPVGFMQKVINNSFIFDTGVGFASCELLEMKQINNEYIYIKVKGTSCLKFKNQVNVDTPPDCDQWEICIVEYKLNKKQIQDLKNKKINKINLIGNVLQKKVKSN